MENLLIYFVKVNGLIALFYLMYVLFLRKETFFTPNRWYFLSGLVLSLILPLVTFTKTIWIEPTPISEVYEESIPFTYSQVEIPVQETIDWSLILMSAYIVISILIILKIGMELVSFFRRIQKQNKQKESDYTLVDSNSAENPFSFFSYIVINRDMFTEEELQHILTHESIHVKQKHSFDVLIGKVFCAIFWVNPIIWLYRKAMLQNLEFIADNETFQQIENKYLYQKTLLKVVTHQHDLSITNQFYQSLIKKRIVMLHTNQSNKKNVWKYATILPLLVGFMLLFQIETVAQVKESKIEETNYAVSSNYSSILTKNTTDKELRELEKTFSDEKHKLKISKVKRNKKGEIIEIKLLFDSGKTYVEILERKSTEPIDAIKIFINSDKDDNVTCGFEEVDNRVVEADLVDDYNNDNEPTEKYWSMDNMKKNGKDVVLIINGKIKGTTEKVKFPIDEELGDMEEITPNEFEKKYKQKADKNKYYYEVETVKVKVKKNVSIEHLDFPTPPTPPTPPNHPFENLMDAPTPPDFPEVPDFPSNIDDKKAMEKYEKAMVSFEKKMKAIEPKMKEFEKKMEVYEKEIKLKEPDMKKFEEEMKIFEQKMKVFEKEMEIYLKEIEKHEGKTK
ncbi:M56 family metallopeptidase [Flavobacterium sp. UBA7663]|uniref:M56 family metallopeptidase n=1 Tax=Flavobacterium sp. UBA7663 TaxID=1946557 RepID=UPI0025BCCC28|nr:M56 family metallopeptidase [Flavobacterium sp. UBA7663]